MDSTKVRSGSQIDVAKVSSTESGSSSQNNSAFTTVAGTTASTSSSGEFKIPFAAVAGTHTNSDGRANASAPGRFYDEKPAAKSGGHKNSSNTNNTKPMPKTAAPPAPKLFFTHGEKGGPHTTKKKKQQQQSIEGWSQNAAAEEGLHNRFRRFSAFVHIIYSSVNIN